MTKIIRTNSENPDFQTLVTMLDQELAILDGADHLFYAQFNTLNKITQAVVAYWEDQPVGCGTIRAYDPDTVEIKRMYVLPAFRGRGIAGGVLSELEAWAGELGCARCLLETGKKQPEAIRLYQKAGYATIPNFGQYAQMENSVCMEKATRQQN